MHKVSGTYDHLEYMKAVNKPVTSDCHRGFVLSLAAASRGEGEPRVPKIAPPQPH
jgi:hypothetical protein